MRLGRCARRSFIAAALDAVRADCESGDRDRMFGTTPVADNTNIAAAPRLRRVERVDAGPEAGAVLCIFGSRDDGSDTQVRYSLAHKADASTTSVFSIATEQHASIESLFPVGRDSPGDDLPGIPRPEGSRRDFSATFEGEAYAVRIYEAQQSMPEVVARYDAQMIAAGWSRSAAVASAFPDARSYTKGPLEVVASFEQREGATIVSLASLEPLHPASPSTR